jgi:hypothetical protein
LGGESAFQPSTRGKVHDESELDQSSRPSLGPKCDILLVVVQFDCDWHFSVAQIP